MKIIPSGKVLSLFLLVLFLVSGVLANPALASAYNAAATNSTAPATYSATATSYASVPSGLPSVLSSAQSLGSLSLGQQLTLQLVLPLRNTANLNSLLTNLYNPNSADYRQFITASQFNQMFGPSPSEVSALTTYLQRSGIQVQTSTLNVNVLQLKGSVEQIENALKTQLDTFKYNGEYFYSTVSSALLPSQFSNIEMISGLNNFSQAMTGGAVPLYRMQGSVNQEPLGSVYYTPSEISTIYNSTKLLSSGVNGTGETIAIVDAYGDPYIRSELATFDTQFGLNAPPSFNIICVDTDSPGGCDYYSGISEGWNAEVALDVEWSHAMAPGASINLYIGQDSGDALNAAELYAVDQMGCAGVNVQCTVFGTTYGYLPDNSTLGPTTNNIISNSWGEPENDLQSTVSNTPDYGNNYPWMDQIFQAAAAEGITVFASSGDWGAYDQSFGQTSPYGGAIYPSTDPWVTGVGGTSTYMNVTSGQLQIYGGYGQGGNATGSYGTETAWSWNNVRDFGTGGGYSTIFTQPNWQTGPGVQNNGMRGDPDVAWDADPYTGVTVQLDAGVPFAGLWIFGGTSVGSPSWAGSMALLDQLNGGGLGFINPSVYSILNNPTEYAKAFHDITVGNNNPNVATAGWDPLTGVGTPNIGYLANYLTSTVGPYTVAVTNDYSGAPSTPSTNAYGYQPTPTQGYAYGQTVTLYANVTSSGSPVTSGVTVTANITSETHSSSGTKLVANNIALSYNSTAGLWEGTYTIKATDPPGQWLADVKATGSGGSSYGYTAFQVGDGITVWSPGSFGPGINSFFMIGDTIQIGATVWNPTNTVPITSGPGASYTATFYLDNPQGKVEGTVPLNYNPDDCNAAGACYWEGAFQIPASADQGPWVVVVTGHDDQGNWGVAYSWINVGLDIFSSTDANNYVLGDSISISAVTGASTGTFTAVVSQGSTVLGKVPLSYGFSTGEWTGTFKISATDPTGYYAITVNGTDSSGNSGSYTQIVDVGKSTLAVSTTLSSPTFTDTAQNASEVITSTITNGGVTVKSGPVYANIYQDIGGVQTYLTYYEMTYNPGLGAYTATINIGSASPLFNIGKYDVVVEAYDAANDYGTSSSSFWITAPPFNSNAAHNSITLTSDSSFTSLNIPSAYDVFTLDCLASCAHDPNAGNTSDPFVIAGVNVTGISITGSITDSYALLDDWVQGNASSGIVLNTPWSSPFLIWVYSVNNGGNGLLANNATGGVYEGVFAANNAKNGILVGNDTQAYNGGIVASMAWNNNGNGIEYQNSIGARMSGVPQEQIAGDMSFNNKGTGLLFYDSTYPIAFENSAENNGQQGLAFTGPSGGWYGTGLAVYNTLVGNNNGLWVDGMRQTTLVNPSYIEAVYNDIEFNAQSGFNVTNNGVGEIGGSTFFQNGVGASSSHSLMLLQSNDVENSTTNGIQVNGQGIYVYQTPEGYWATELANNTLVANSGSGISVNSMETSALVYNNTDAFNTNGVAFSNVNNSEVVANALGYNTNGFVLLGGADNTVEANLAILNTGTGIMVNGSSSNFVTGNEVAETAGTDPSFGILLTNGATSNAVVSNELLYDTAGVGLQNVQGNTIGTNTFEDCQYGIYLVNSASNDWTTNAYIGNTQNLYPSAPAVTFASGLAGSTVSGNTTISWTTSGQGSPTTTFWIDGVRQITSGSSFSWNTASLPDGGHTLTLIATNSGGLSTSTSIVVFTNNVAKSENATISSQASSIASENATISSQASSIASENATISSLGKTIASLQAEVNQILVGLSSHVLTVQTVAPGGTALPSETVSVTNSSGFSTTGLTNGSGIVQFLGLAPSRYTVSATINGTLLTTPVQLISNATVILEPPNVSTVVSVTTSTGQKLQLTVTGNITSSQISNTSFQTLSNGTVILQFTVTGMTGTVGTATITIPKSDVPAGSVPKVYIDGTLAASQSYTQDTNNFYVTFSLHFSTHTVEIRFAVPPPPTPKYNWLEFAVIGVVVVAVVAGGLLVAIRRRKGSGSRAPA